MLETIARSTARQKILGLFFLNEEKSYYQRQLAKELGIAIGQVQREIQILEKEGILNRDRLGNLILLKVNKAYPLYKEIKQVVLKTVGVVPRLKEALGRLDEADVAFIYGSFAHDRWTSGSDIDLLVVGDIRKSRLTKELTPIGQDIDRTINSTLYSREEITRKLKGKDGFLMEVLSKPIIPIKGMGQSGKRGEGKALRFKAGALISIITRGKHGSGKD